MVKKTDNDNRTAKLALRRFFLRRYHVGTCPLVLDCCEGGRVLWGTIEREFACTVWGVDLKPATGRLAVDSRRLLEADGIVADVVDIDSYGEPWTHWVHLITGSPRPLTVFLTWGFVGISGGVVSMCQRDVLGITFPTLKVPSVLMARPSISRFVPRAMIARAAEQGWRVIEAKEAAHGKNARYFGVRLDAA